MKATTTVKKISGNKGSVEGPRGVFIDFDASEICPNEPGNGTPLIVRLGRETATFWCAEDGCSDLDLDPGQLRWLSGRAESAGNWLRSHGG